MMTMMIPVLIKLNKEFKEINLKNDILMNIDIVESQDVGDVDRQSQIDNTMDHFTVRQGNSTDDPTFETASSLLESIINTASRNEDISAEYFVQTGDQKS